MKKNLIIVLLAITSISLTGCYTQVAVQEDDDSYVYQPIIYYPAPEPIPFPAPIPYPPKEPEQPIYKERKPIKRPPGGNIRNPGKKRDPITPPKRDDFRNHDNIRKPVTPPKSNDRITDDSRYPGGRHDGGRKGRR